MNDAGTLESSRVKKVSMQDAWSLTKCNSEAYGYAPQGNCLNVGPLRLLLVVSGAPEGL